MAVFPESDYPPPAELAEAYAFRQKAGHDALKSFHVVFCGLARQLGERVHETIEAIEHLGSLFADYHVAIYENDSEDDTPRHLALWAEQNPRVFVRSEHHGRPHWPATRIDGRTHDMAAYRNRNHRDAMKRAGGADYAIVLDTDIGCYSADGLADTFIYWGWDAMASNGLATIRGKVVQLDAYAWRDPGHPGPMTARQINPRVLVRGQLPVPVLSAFGGMAVYRMECFARGRYAGGDCEHVAFHRAFPRMFVNPSQIVLYP